VSIEKIEAEALKLDANSRARLAEKLLESLEHLSEEENERLWAEEACRRDADLDAKGNRGKSSADALREALQA
jgi:putative addiction module component